MKRSIERYIIANQLAPGDKLPTEAELCRLFDVSRTAVREAMKMLAAFGVVSIEAGRGTFVRQFDVSSVLSALPATLIFLEDDFFEVTEVRRHLEMYCVERAVALIREDPEHPRAQELIETVEQMELRARLGEDMAAEDARFHRTLAQMADNRVLLLILEIFWKLRETLPADNSPDELRERAERHRQLLEAILRGDEAEAKKQLNIHYHHTLKEIGADVNASEPENRRA